MTGIVKTVGLAIASIAGLIAVCGVTVIGLKASMAVVLVVRSILP